MSLLQLTAVFIGLVGAPGWFVVALWRAREESRFRWLIRSLYTGALLLLLFIVAPWEWASYYLRYVWIVLFVVAAYISFQRTQSRSFALQRDSRTWSDVVSLAIFLALL